MKWLPNLFFAATLSVSISLAPLALAASSAPSGDQVAYLQTQWAVDNYQRSGKQQQQSFVALIEQADQMIKEHPQQANLYTWRGIIKSTFAGIKGGLGALGLAKEAKKDFEHAIELDPQTGDGSAYTSLGTLYFSVPGWPIGFGDTEKAEALLKKGLAINPNGIDSNYFYAQFLLDEGRYQEAEQFLQLALNATPRVGRALADSGRKQEVETALSEVRKHLH